MLVLDEADKLLSQDFKGMLDKVGNFSIFMGVTLVCFFLYFSAFRLWCQKWSDNGLKVLKVSKFKF